HTAREQLPPHQRRDRGRVSWPSRTRLEGVMSTTRPRFRPPIRAALAATGSMLVLLACSPVAGATISSVFTTAQTSPPGGIPCTVQTGANAGVRLCNASPRSTVKTFDGVPIDVNVMFAPEPANGPDGNYPVVAMFSGWPPAKFGL